MNGTSLLIKDAALQERWDKHLEISSAGKHPLTPGVHWAIVDPRQDGGQHSDRMVAGRPVHFTNRTALTEDRELAQAAQAAGYPVVPREKHVASTRAYFGGIDMSHMTDSRKKETRDAGNDGDGQQVPSDGGSTG